MTAKNSTLCLSLDSGEFVLVGPSLIRIRKIGKSRVDICIQSPTTTKIFSERLLRKLLDPVQLQAYLDQHFPRAVSTRASDPQRQKRRGVA